MKKSCKVLCLMLIVFMMSGCVKANIDISINKDKSMKLSILSAMDESLLQQYGSEGLMDEETKNEAENNGFKVDEYSDGSMKGYTLSKEFKNIDDISSDKKVNFDLEKLMDGEDAKIFTVKKGFFKNTYSAIMGNNTSSELESQMDFGNTTDSLDYTNDNTQDIFGDSYNQDSSFDFSSNLDMSSLASSMDMKFNVTLPYEAIKSNATSTENDGKKLVWNLMDSNLKSIEFEFELYNMNNIYLTAGIAGVIILIIIIAIVSKKRKPKKTEGTPVPVVTQTVENTNENVAPAVSITNEEPTVTSNAVETPVTQVNQGSQIMSGIVEPKEQINETAPVQNEINKVVENTVSNNVEPKVVSETPVTQINNPQAMDTVKQPANETAPIQTAVDANIFNSTPNSENK